MGEKKHRSDPAQIGSRFLRGHVAALHEAGALADGGAQGLGGLQDGHPDLGHQNAGDRRSWRPLRIADLGRKTRLE